MSRAIDNTGVRVAEQDSQVAAAFIVKSPQVHTVDGWPAKPRALRERDWLWVVVFILDTVSILLALSFVVLAMITIGLNGQPISPWGEKVKAATLLGPTIFPIVFARIVSRTVKASALDRAAKGAKLGVLEQLMGSVTIFSTLEVQLLLRSFNFLGCTLILVWALSPLGGQASLRLLGNGTHAIRSQQDLKYLSSDSVPLNYLTDYYNFEIDGLYSAALFSPPNAQATGMDLWGNVKIPVLETLQSGNSESEGWLTVNSSNATYSSLLGLPIDGLATSGQSTFTVETYYMTLDCPFLDHVSREEVNWTSMLSEEYRQTQPDDNSSFCHENNTNNVFGFIVDSKSNFSRHGVLLPNESPYSAAPPYVLFASIADEGYNATLANCSLTRSSVESNITCQGTSCAVTQMRRSTFDRRPSDYTPLYANYTRLTFWSSWANAAGVSLPFITTATPTELFIQNGSLTAAFATLSQALLVANLYELPARTFSVRLSLLWNTYWQCRLAPQYQTGYLPSNLTEFPDQGLTGNIVNATTATVTRLQPVYVSNHPWAIMLLIASLVLFICGIYGAILKCRTVAPDVLGNVSSLTRDNPYVPLPGGGTALDGLERARLLKDLKVRLQDVTPGDPLGHIALGCMAACLKGCEPNVPKLPGPTPQMVRGFGSVPSHGCALLASAHAQTEPAMIQSHKIQKPPGTLR
ncbi:MAG: hypothetical protein FRX48_06610 [Lasallia pustulata]|uniref:Uncharacterized protein n=1 Tax=Lasallia pustulata TaxID=136370 RepID=A0A5M8PMS9_9LECA|nr:MAG: hypothetical protein FRX48_06610 [Lasallia pustulata]